MKNFEFWPHDYHDVEKPSTQAKDYEFIWRLPLITSTDESRPWIKSREVKQELDGQELVRLSVVYPFHFRYQPAREGAAFTKLAFPGPPNEYNDSESFTKNPLKSYSKQIDIYPRPQNLVTKNNAPQVLFEMIPNGIKEDLPYVLLFTFGSTFLGFIILSYTIVKKSFEKIGGAE